MPYYGDGLPYYYGGPFANHSSLISSSTRTLHTPLSRFSPHLSTISESPLSSLRRYSPVSVSTRPRRVIDTADIDVSTPRILSRDGNRQRNRLRRDRPTIKIRSQALKDNPALREHNERHEKSVGELLVEKFLIKDKKLEEAERRLRVYHQVSLDRNDDPDEAVTSKITRRFTRRRSSADIQLDPEQLEREVAYAQVQAEVLDSLLAEEQAEIENEVRRGTLIRKGTIGGPRTVPSFFRNVDQDSVSQEDDQTEDGALRIKKTLKKVKKKKKPTDKPSPPDGEDNLRDSRRSSTSSDVSIELKREEKPEERERGTSKPQMYRIEASNSAGDFTTVLLNAGHDEGPRSIEQFRESVKIPVPKRFDAEVKEELEETKVVLPVRKPYVKDTSRNSVYFTVKTPPENVRQNPLEKSGTIANGIDELEKTRGEDNLEINLENRVKPSGLKKDSGKEKETWVDSIISKKADEKLVKSNGLGILKPKKPSDPAGKDEEGILKKETSLRAKEVEANLKKGVKAPGSSSSGKDTSSDSIISKIDEDEKLGKSNGFEASKPQTPSAAKDEVEPMNDTMVSKILAPNLNSAETQKNSQKIPPSSITWKKKDLEDKPTKVKLSEALKPKKPSTSLENITSNETMDSKTLPPNLNSAEAEKNSQKIPPSSITWKKKDLEDKPTKVKLSETSKPKKSSASLENITSNDTMDSKTLPPNLNSAEAEKNSQKIPSSAVTWKKDLEDKSTKVKLSETSKPKKPTEPLTKDNKTAPNLRNVDQSESNVRPENITKQEATGTKEDTSDRRDVVAIARDTNDNSASAVLAPSVARLPKVSKINTDENNAVEAPELSLRGETYLATKSERDEDVVRPLPGKRVNKGVTLTKTSSSDNLDKPGKSKGTKEDDSVKTNGATDVSTTLQVIRKNEEPRNEEPKVEEEKEIERILDTKTKVEDIKNNEATKDQNCTKSKGNEVERNGGEEPNSFKAVTSAASKCEDKSPIIGKEINSCKSSKVENDRISNDKSALNSKIDGDNGESKFPWKRKALITRTDSDVKSKNLKEDSNSVDAVRNDSKLLQNEKTLENQIIKSPQESLDDAINKMQIEKPGLKFLEKDRHKNSKIIEDSVDDSGTLSKSTSTESIDFWSEIKAPGSPITVKPKGLNFGVKKIPETLQADRTEKGVPDATTVSDDTRKPMKELDKKKETDPKISVAPPPVGRSNIPVIEEKRKPEAESKTEKTPSPESPLSKPETVKDTLPVKKEPRKKKLAISIAPRDVYSTVKKTPLKREDSPSTNSPCNTPDTAIPTSQVSTPTLEHPVPLINIVAAPPVTPVDSQGLEEEEDPTTPTNEVPESALGKITKWENQGDLSKVETEKEDVTPVPSNDVSLNCSPESSKKKKIVKKKKPSTKKNSVVDKDSKDSKKEAKESRKEGRKDSKENLSLKPPDNRTSSSPRNSPRNSPTQRPIDLIKMFYTTPTALLTATPRDLSKVRRAKIKRRKHQSRTPSVSSDSTGSTTSTATTESTDGSGSTCTELDDDPEHKRMNSTRSNDSGFDGSPRISTPSQSSDTQRNSDSSDHFPSGRITPPATNLPRFKKYCVTDFNFLKVLGKGSFGKVLLAELRGTECVYAVKCLKKDVVLEDDDVECTLIERKVLTLATRHPYLCHLFCTFQTESHLFFVMEYLNGGDLMFHIQKSGRFTETRARFYAAEIWSGLNFLHKKGIVYRDLKLDNVLLDFEGHIRIADFGMCKLQIFLDRTADTFCGTPDYMAPEIIKGLKYNQAVDWWSYGVLLYEMLTGQSPFSGCDEDELFWSICNERPFIPRYLSQEATDILVCLLEKDSGKRLPGHEIALHSFFQSLPWDRLERRQLDAPFKPALDHTLDTKYFDTAFTAERPRLTPVPDQILTSMDQGVFRGFSYTNPNATD